MPLFRQILPLYRNRATGIVTTVYSPTLDPWGCRIVWSEKPTQDLVVTDLPNNVRTVADASDYLNASVGTGPNPFNDPAAVQTRAGQFFGCYMWVHVISFEKDLIFSYEFTGPSDWYFPNPYTIV